MLFWDENIVPVPVDYYVSDDDVDDDESNERISIIDMRETESKSSCSDESYDSNKFMSELSSKLNEFRSSGTLCDMKIHVGTRSFHVHKAILCAASDYFLAMFTSGFKENSLQEVHIDGNGDTFAEVLNYTYTGRLQTSRQNLTNTKVVEIFQMAAYLQLGNILEMCRYFLMDNVFDTNPREWEASHKLGMDELLVIWQLADAHDFQDVSKECSQILLSKLFFSLDESERELINKGVSCGQILQCLDGNLLRRLKGNCGEGDIFVDSCFWWKVLEYLQESHLRSSLEYPKMDTTLTTMKDKDPMEDSKYDIHLVSNIVNWIAYDWSRRSCNAAEILGKVGLGCLSVERLTKIVDHRFEGIPECKAVLDRLIALKSSQDSYQLKLSCPDLFCSRTMLVGQVAIKWEDRSCYLFTTVHEGTYKHELGDNAKKHVYSCEAILNVHGRLYSSRGYDDFSCKEVNTFIRYDAEIDRWIRLEPMLYARNKHAMVYLKDNIYVIGGAFYDKRDLYFSVMCQKYNVCREDWNMVADLPENVEYPCAVAFKGMLIVVGQRHIINDMVECVIQVYNPNSDHWFLQEALTKFKQPSDPRFRSRFPKCKLSVQNGECYQIWYQSVSENDRERDGLYVSHVCKLVCDFEGKVPVVAIGEKVNQSMIPPNKHRACVMNKRVYVDKGDMFCKTIIVVEDDAKMVDLNVRDGLGMKFLDSYVRHTAPALFKVPEITGPVLKKSNGGCSKR